jgi:hypothetical protein
VQSGSDGACAIRKKDGKVHRYWCLVRSIRAADASPQAVDQPGSRPMAGARAVGWAPKSPIFWALAIALTAYWVVFSAFIFHAYPLLLERGFDTQAVVFAMAVIGPAQVVGRIAIWVFAGGVQIRVIGSLVVLSAPPTLSPAMVLPW